MTIAITIAGNVSQDATVRHTPNGDAVAQWSIASSQGKEKPAIFLRCTLFGKRADSALPSYIVKGTPVTVIGTLAQQKYKDKQTGEEKTSFEVKVSEIVLQGGKRDQEQPKPAPSRAPAKDFSDLESDCPF